MMETFFFFLFQIFLVFFPLSNCSSCLNIDNTTQLCDFCSYDSYSSVNYLLNNFSSSKKLRIPADECIPKNNTLIKRSILIINNENATFNDLSNFDAIYSDIFVALETENLILNQ